MKNFIVPYLSKEQIRDTAEKFRSKFKLDDVPVDIQHVVEVCLEMDIIPVPDLKPKLDVDALITASWKSIYVDQTEYMNEKYDNRIRFSLAHEVGHYILHKDIYEALDIKYLKDFYKFFKDCPEKQYEYLEVQAQMFANNLLVPRYTLSKKRFEELKRIPSGTDVKTFDQKTLNAYMAIPISRHFGVSEDVIQIALGDLDRIESQF